MACAEQSSGKGDTKCSNYKKLKLSRLSQEVSNPPRQRLATSRKRVLRHGTGDRLGDAYIVIGWAVQLNFEIHIISGVFPLSFGADSNETSVLARGVVLGGVLEQGALGCGIDGNSGGSDISDRD